LSRYFDKIPKPRIAFCPLHRDGVAISGASECAANIFWILGYALVSTSVPSVHEAFDRGQTDAAVLAGTSISNVRLCSRDRAKTVNAVNSNLSTTAARGPRKQPNRFDSNSDTCAGTDIGRGSIVVGRALQLKLITNAVQVELLRWLARPARHRHDNALARCQIRYKAK
jgi:hypothetical protein